MTIALPIMLTLISEVASPFRHVASENGKSSSHITVAYEFCGYQALLSTTDDNELLSWQPTFNPVLAARPPRTNALLALEGSVALFDGQCWGDAGGNTDPQFCIQWDVPLDGAVRFHMVQKSLFSDGAKIAGVAPGFAYDGYCNTRIETKTTGDDSARWFWTNVGFDTKLFRYIRDPAHAFIEDYSKRQSSIDRVPWGNGTRASWRSEDGRTEVVIWIFPLAQLTSAQYWVLAEKGTYQTRWGDVEGTLLYCMLSRQLSEHRELPMQLNEIPVVHSNVPRASQTFIDPLSPWSPPTQLEHHAAKATFIAAYWVVPSAAMAFFWYVYNRRKRICKKAF